MECNLEEGTEEDVLPRMAGESHSKVISIEPRLK